MSVADTSLSDTLGNNGGLQFSVSQSPLRSDYEDPGLVIGREEQIRDLEIFFFFSLTS